MVRTRRGLDAFLSITPRVTLTSIRGSIHFENAEDAGHDIDGLRKAGLPDE